MRAQHRYVLGQVHGRGLLDAEALCGVADRQQLPPVPAPPLMIPVPLVALGATAVVWPEHRSAPLSPATFRASAGAIEHATLCRVTSLPPALDDLRARGVAVIGLDMTGEVAIDRVDLVGPVALVVGAEDKGLRKTVKRACDALARLPMPGPIGSLNASVAVAIALYEVVRQRGARQDRKL